MKGIKYALAFVWGFLYAITVGSLLRNDNNELHFYLVYFAVATTVVVVAMTVYYLATHWKDN